MKAYPLAIAAALAFGAAHAATAEPPKPNIIYILADDLGIADVGVYGNRFGATMPREILTPNIDRIAADGILFTQHYSASTVCAPTRSCLMTGLHTGHTRSRGNRDVDGFDYPLKDSDVTLAELLKQAGYRTGAVGKWGLGGPDGEGNPGRQGFDYFYGYLGQRNAHNYYPHDEGTGNHPVFEIINGTTANVTLRDFAANDPSNGEPTVYSHDLFIKNAAEFITQSARDENSEPFFLYMALTIPHSHVEVPEIDAAYTDKPWTDKTKTFASMVTRMDTGIGEVVALLDALNIADNTLIIFSSDNGPHSEGGHDAEALDSNGIFRGIKRDLYEGGIRAPMLARWPGKIAPATTTDHISAQWDVLPTLCEVAGAAVPETTDGISLVPALLGKGNEQARHKNLYWEFHEQKGRQAIRQGNLKAVRYNAFTPEPHQIELYDLDTDPRESNDIAALHPEKVEEFTALMITLRTPHAEWPTPLDAEKKNESF